MPSGGSLACNKIKYAREGWSDHGVKQMIANAVPYARGSYWQGHLGPNRQRLLQELSENPPLVPAKAHSADDRR